MTKQPSVSPQRLPGLTVGGRTWLLPITDFGATELGRILLLDGPDQQIQALAELMAVEPSLTLWVACRAGSWGGECPRCVASFAGWLTRQLDQVLHWDPERTVPKEVPRTSLNRWRELSANSVAVANLAAEQMDDDSLAAESFLMGLLHNAVQWCSSAGARIAVSQKDDGCLPVWLGDWLRARTGRPRSETAKAVSRANKMWRDSGRRVTELAGVRLSDLGPLRRRWQTMTAAADDLSTLRQESRLLPVLAARLRRLHELERDFQKTLEQEKLESLGQLAYGASHEINNPLANICTRAQTLLHDETEPDRRRMLAVINTQAFRANEMIADMMLFARPPELARESIDVWPLIQSVIDELSEEAEIQATEFALQGDPTDCRLWGDPIHLALALRAVCVNALEALGSGGTIHVTCEQVDGDQGPWVHVHVQDSGPGISKEVRRHLFDPFYSGREAGRGLGLGLSKCWRVITLHGGQVRVASRAGRGTTVTLCLPADRSHVARGSDPARVLSDSGSMDCELGATS